MDIPPFSTSYIGKSHCLAVEIKLPDPFDTGAGRQCDYERPLP
jgi:hypothetical protein